MIKKFAAFFLMLFLLIGCSSTEENKDIETKEARSRDRSSYDRPIR